MIAGRNVVLRGKAGMVRVEVGLVTACLAGMVLAASAAAEAPSPAVQVPVGVAKVDITPQTPVRMYGYAARKTESEKVAGPLKASALALGDEAGPGPAVLLTVDCGAVPDTLRQEVFRRVQKQFSLKPERFVLCNSHNQSGPDLKGLPSMTGTQRQHLEQYARLLVERLESVVIEALKSRRPGQLAWTVGNVPFAANRRVLKEGRWTGFGAVLDAPADRSLPLLRIADAQGKLLAVVFNYACHNTTLRGNFTRIHGDWAGCAQEYIEADHPGAVALVTIGCGADADPYPHGTVELCQQHGRQIADEVKRLLAGPLRPVRFPLVARSATLEIPFAPLPPLEELQTLAKRSYSAQRMLRLVEQGQKPPASRSYPITVWAFDDDLAMVFLGDEVVVDYALRMKRQFDGSRLWITAYAHGVSNYIVSRRLLAEGGYEVNNSLSTLVTFGRPELLQPPMEDRIVEQVGKLLPASFLAPR